MVIIVSLSHNPPSMIQNCKLSVSSLTRQASVDTFKRLDSRYAIFVVVCSHAKGRVRLAKGG